MEKIKNIISIYKIIIKQRYFVSIFNLKRNLNLNFTSSFKQINHSNRSATDQIMIKSINHLPIERFTSILERLKVSKIKGTRTGGQKFKYHKQSGGKYKQHKDTSNSQGNNNGIRFVLNKYKGKLGISGTFLGVSILGYNTYQDWKDKRDEFINLPDQISDFIETNHFKSIKANMNYDNTSLLHFTKNPVHYTDFIERNCFERLEDSKSSSQICKIAITGLPGTGKTELAKHYAHKYNKERWHFVTKNIRGIKQEDPKKWWTIKFDTTPPVIWLLDAEKLEELETQYLSLAKKLGISENLLKTLPNENKDSFIKRITNEVTHKLKLHHGSLLLFIKVKDYDSIQNYLPHTQDSNIKILITSQQENFFNENKYQKNIAIDEAFTEKEWIQLLEKINGKNIKISDNEIEYNAMQQIFNKLGKLPLALSLSAKFIKQEQMNFKEYLQKLINEEDVLEENSKEIAKKENYTLMQVAVLSLSAKKIENVNSNTKQLLQLCSLLESKHISKELLLQYFSNSLNERNKQKVEIELIKAINNLKNYSLLNQEKKDQYYINPLVKQITLKDLSEQNQLNIIKLLLTSFVEPNFINKDARKDSEIARLNQLFPHAEKLIKQLNNFVRSGNLNQDTTYLINKIRLLDIMGFFCTQSGNIEKANNYLSEAKKSLEEIYAISIDDINFDDRNPNKKLNIDLIKPIMKKLMPKNDPALADLYVSILYSLGRMYFYNKNPNMRSQSIRYLKVAQAISQWVGEIKQQPRLHMLLIEQNGLLYFAIESKNKFDLEYAAKRYQELLQDNQIYFDTSSQKNIDLNQKKYQKMICHRQLARIYRQLAELSMITSQEGKAYIAEAIKDAKEAINIAEKALAQGESFGRLADYYNNLGEIYLDDIEANHEISIFQDEAKKLFNKAITHEREKQDYPLANAHYGLARCYALDSTYQSLFAAKKHIDACVKIRQEIYSPNRNHPNLQKAIELQKEIAALLVSYKPFEAIEYLPGSEDDALLNIQRYFYHKRPYLSTMPDVQLPKIVNANDKQKNDNNFKRN